MMHSVYADIVDTVGFTFSMRKAAAEKRLTMNVLHIIAEMPERKIEKHQLIRVTTT